MADSEGPELEKQISARIVERIADGDKEAERELCERYYQRLHYFIKRRASGDASAADDICQQTFLKALEKLRTGDIREPSSLGAWLHGIAIRDVMNESRKAQRQATAADTELIEQTAALEAGPLERISDQQVQEALKQCLNGLSESDRTVLIRLYLKDEDRAAICESEGYSPAQLNNIAWRAKQRLKKQILEQAENEELKPPGVVRLVR